MQFQGPLGLELLQKVAACDDLLRDPNRVAAVNRTGLMGSPNEEAFDRLAHLAAKLLDVPLTIISLVGDEKQFFKAGYGLPAPYDTQREIPIDESICRYTLRNEAIIASNCSRDPLLKYHPTIGPWGIGAFVAIPMVTSEGHVIGAFCAVDSKEKQWTDRDILVMRELTSSVMSEIKLRQQISQLRAERELREQFVISLSHDLRNPLSVVRMGLSILDDSEISGAEHADIKVTISQNLSRAEKMIEDLLTASRYTSESKPSLEKVECDIILMIRNTKEIFESVHKRKFQFSGPHHIDGNWDVERIRRILENLSSNAVKYGDPDKPISIIVKSLGSEGISISVHNHGAAISEAELENLFHLFYRSESAISGTKSGWGVGLTVVRALAEEMGGRITVESSSSQGTVFSLFLPN